MLQSADCRVQSKKSRSILFSTLSLGVFPVDVRDLCCMDLMAVCKGPKEVGAVDDQGLCHVNLRLDRDGD